jgi:hypothetical protein
MTMSFTFEVKWVLRSSTGRSISVFYLCSSMVLQIGVSLYGAMVNAYARLVAFLLLRSLCRRKTLLFNPIML